VGSNPAGYTRAFLQKGKQAMTPEQKKAYEDALKEAKDYEKKMKETEKKETK
jgi:hypothetical protein